MGRLVEQSEGISGYRHYLDGEPVHAGEILEMYRNGQWTAGRYEWNYKAGSKPAFYLSQDRAVWIEPDDELRWPAS